jgi:3-oxoacyl-[acyl-carrier-protein] synthase II
MLPRRVAITGLGLVCSQGQQPAAVFELWRQGLSGIACHTLGAQDHTLHLPYALCRDFDPAAQWGRAAVSTMDRVSQLSLSAASDAWQDAGLAGLDQPSLEEAGVFWGTGAAGANTTDKGYRELFLQQRSRISPLSVVQGMHNAAAAHIAFRLGLGGACFTYSIACASSAIAIGEAFLRIQQGQLSLAIAGGGEAALPYGSLKAWESMQILAPAALGAQASRPFHAERAGLVLGEGAAALVLEDWQQAQARGAHIYAEVIGYGSSCDHHHITSPDSRGQIRAMQQALRHAQLDAAQIDYVNAHGTATKDGDATEVASLRAVFGDHAAQLSVSSTKSMHGHLLGAAGAIESLACALSLQQGSAPPTANLAGQLAADCLGLAHITLGQQPAPLHRALSNSFAFGGSNAVLILQSAA